MPNKCCGQHFFMWNCYIFHLLHHLSECVIYNHKVRLQNFQSLPYFPLLHLGFFQFQLWFMEFLIQLCLNKHNTCIIIFPFLFVGFKFKGINTVFNVLLLIQYYALQMFQLQGKLLDCFTIGLLHIPCFLD